MIEHNRTGGLDVSWQNKPQELVFAYVRVSSADHNPDRQLALFKDLAEDHIYIDYASGGNTDRAQLQMLMRILRRGDTLLVKSPDRLARNTVDLLTIAHQLRDRGVDLEFVDTPSLNVDSATGEFMLTIYAGFATMERAMIRERQAEGIAIAKAGGKYDREPKLTADQVAAARARVESGVSKSRVARELGVSRTTLYRALAGEGIYGAKE